MPTLTNTAEGGTLTAAVTTGNSGGASGNAWDSVAVGGALTYDNTHNRGAVAYKVVGDTVNPTYMTWSTALGTVGEVWGRIYLYLTAAPSAATGLVRLRVGGVQTMRIQLATAGAGQLEIRKNSGNTLVGTVPTACATNQWIRFEYHLLAVTSGAQLEVRLYNTADSATATDQFSSTGDTLTSANVDEVAVGHHNASAASTLWMDDIEVNTTGWPGPSVTPIPHLLAVARRRPALPAVARATIW